ncbi:hypothetical protein [Microbacterium sp.]|uniref:hypothetical protein n=1 Tax=Microbacterium sp. TaxID=51671 RepID=UPI003F71D37C
MVAALGTWAAVVVAIGAGYLIWWQIRQTRQLAEEQARPYVVVWVEVETETRSTLEFHVKNIGLTAAHDVHVSLDPPYKWHPKFEGMNFMDAAIFNDGIPTMPPGWDVGMTMDMTKDLIKADEVPAPITATVVYSGRRSAEGRPRSRKLNGPWSEQFTLDIAYLRGSLWLDKHGIHHLAQSVRAIAKKQGVTAF